MNSYILSKDTYLKLDFSLSAKLAIYAGIVCFSLSLFLTSLFTSGGDIYGYWLLLIGWIGLVIFQFSWFANPLNLLALLLVKKRPVLAIFLSVFALLVASQTFYFLEIPSGLADKKTFIKELGFGFYLWYLSQMLFLLGVCLEVMNNKNER